MSQVKFEHKCLGYNNDQDHFEYCCDIYAHIKGHYKCVGYCKYYSIGVDKEIVYIEFINISHEHRRKGYGTALVKELVKKYILHWDYKFTKDGRKWYESLIERNII